MKSFAAQIYAIAYAIINSKENLRYDTKGNYFPTFQFPTGCYFLKEVKNIFSHVTRGSLGEFEIRWKHSPCGLVFPLQFFVLLNFFSNILRKHVQLVPEIQDQRCLDWNYFFLKQNNELKQSVLAPCIRCLQCREILKYMQAYLQICASGEEKWLTKQLATKLECFVKMSELILGVDILSSISLHIYAYKHREDSE